MTTKKLAWQTRCRRLDQSRRQLEVMKAQNRDSLTILEGAQLDEQIRHLENEILNDEAKLPTGTGAELFDAMLGRDVSDRLSYPE